MTAPIVGTFTLVEVQPRRREDPWDPGGYDVPHTAITYLLDPAGAYRRHYPGAQAPQAVIDDLRALLRTRSGHNRLSRVWWVCPVLPHCACQYGDRALAAVLTVSPVRP